MSDFKAKMHQIRFPLGLRPRPQCSPECPDPLAAFKGPPSKGRKGEWGDGKGEGKGREGKEGEGWPPIGEWIRQ